MSRQVFTADQLKEQFRKLALHVGQSKLANHFGLSESYISRYLHGDRPLPKKIADDLAVRKLVVYDIDDSVFDELKGLKDTSVNGRGHYATEK